MRQLVVCTACQRRYDASAREPGSRFRCHCGAPVEIPRPHSHDAAVVRCAGCGGPINDPTGACPYCGAAVAQDEHDRNTVCPYCFSRVRDQAQFCHSCGNDLRHVESIVAAETELPCPVCASQQVHLTHRQMPGTGLAIHECPSCAGIWLPNSIFDDLARQAKSRSLPPTAHVPTADDGSGTPRTIEKQSGPMYRMCPLCGQMMNRRNYGRVSGVVIDNCKDHGSWFDADELPAVLAFIEDGGLERGAALQAERDAAAQRRLDDRRSDEAVAPMLNQEYDQYHRRQGDDLEDLIEDAVGGAMRMLGRLFKR